MYLRCWFGLHDRQTDEHNSARKFCSRCGMKSILLIDQRGNARWQDISFPDEGFWGLLARFREWRRMNRYMG